ncbi:MAG: ATP-binding protein [Kiloniellales bacterium]
MIKARIERGPPLPVDDPTFRGQLQSLVDELPYLRAIFVIGADGFIVHDTDYPETPHVTLADRDYFVAQQRDPDRGVFVGAPLVSRSVDRWFVPLSRGLVRPDGTFDGAVVAAIEPHVFEAFYRRLSLSELDSVALFHVDGTLIARVPPTPELYGKNLSNLQLFAEHLPHSHEGVFPGVSLAGDNAIIGYKAVDGFPLVVTTAVNTYVALAGWRRSARLVAFGVAFIGVLILLIFVMAERRRLEMQMLEQRALMAYRLETLGQMTSSVAHDFRNVLAVLSSGLRIVRKGGVTEPLLEGIQQAIDRGARLTAGLLDYAKRQEFERQPEYPNRLLQSLEILIRQSAGRKVKVSIELQKGIGTCAISRSQFDAAILNIVVNASHAMPEGGTIRITTRSVSIGAGTDKTPGDYAQIVVADSGSGMNRETLDRIFEPFFTTKEKEGGTGLGLSQVHNFAREAGGYVEIGSELGVGTQVELYLPCSREDRRESGSA